MKKISQKQYLAATHRLEELINLVDDNTPTDDPLTLEFLEISDIIEQYESIHYPMKIKINSSMENKTLPKESKTTTEYLFAQTTIR
ncbi:hypothetical protein [Flagellimonas lutaonensis]|uniref:Uncharacterized protein n=1 Tax=Flagellimonas lutaonensis TaxID=516051 RepID=A0A0D5YW71_9FLAO|nr:hypothetical protein [Allomuricauda lutaonensis]AKA36098.1 hypothetical protein VC82_2529 [Allomuricauda lutaonensis]